MFHLTGCEAGESLQQAGSHAADHRRCHGCAAHGDVAVVHNAAFGTVLQRKVIIRRKNRDDVFSMCPQIWLTNGCGLFGRKPFSVLPCAYRKNVGAKGWRRQKMRPAVWIGCGSHHHNAFVPKGLHCFLQGTMNPSVIGAYG